MCLNFFRWRTLIWIIVIIASIYSCKQDSPLRTTKSSTPNIVFLLIDDLGISATPVYSSDSDESFSWNPGLDSSFAYRTPNINQFSREAKVYSHMYATPSCAPSRAQLITGRYPFRTGIIFPAFRDNQSVDTMHCAPTSDERKELSGYLDTNNVAYPEVLQAIGYKTFFGGKWNLRYGTYMACLDGTETKDPITCIKDTSQYIPKIVPIQAEHLKNMGFDTSLSPVALVGNTIDYYPPQLSSGSDMNARYMPNYLSNWMVNNLIEATQQEEQFYLHYCFGLIHDPYTDAAEHEYGFAPPPQDSGQSNMYEVFADKMKEVDALIGRIIHTIDSLDEVNKTETLIIIAGDNGTENDHYTSYQDTIVQGGKLTYFTQGSRVPFMVRWPNVIPEGEDDQLVDFSDIFPTMVELVDGNNALQTILDRKRPGSKACYNGSDTSADSGSCYIIDGQSFLYQMTDGKKGQEITPRTGIYSQLNCQAFIANKNYKLQIDSTGQGRTGFFKIHNPDLVDQPIVGTVAIDSIGAPVPAISSDFGKDTLDNYRILTNYYYSVFPAAKSVED